MRDDGHPVNDSLTYQDMRDFYARKGFEVKVDQTHLIGMELKMMEPILDCLERRNWCFASAPKGHRFICSDDPVILSWLDEGDKGPYPPGFGLSETIVMFPLSDDLLLVGMFEDVRGRVDYDPDQVAATNTQILQYSTKQIYAKGEDFHLLSGVGELVNGPDVLKKIGGRSAANA
ncbi:DUF4238 domain-containing protein [Limimaricola sp.]|uniref:DUF4238 domain-containing protein n=1 Tax=Limimaricola sp. TaxID=2211665 RepID=UPI004058CCF8